MLDIPKKYIFDEQQHPFAVQIPIKVFEQIEEILENFGLAKLMIFWEDIQNYRQRWKNKIKIWFSPRISYFLNLQASKDETT